MRSTILIISITLLLFSSFDAAADTVYLKNGGVIEGIVKDKPGESIEVEVGFGTITLNKNQVEKIEKASANEEENIRENWDKKRIELAGKEVEFARQRQDRFSNYGQLVNQERERKADAATSAKEVSVVRDPQSKNLYVDTIIDDKVKARLIFDTGASVVVLSHKTGIRLGLDVSKNGKKNIVTLKLAGNRTVEAMMVILDSLRVEHIEARKVIAAILLEDVKDGSFGDGLLGMTFLNRFNLSIDLKRMKIGLDPIEKQDSQT